MRKKIVALILVATGCSTHPVSNNDAREIAASAWTEQKAGYGALVVKRDSGFLGAACSVGVYVDGKQIASLGTSQLVTVYLPPGKHIVGAMNGSLCGGAVSETALTMETDGHETYRIAKGDGGSVTIQPTAF